MSRYMNYDSTSIPKGKAMSEWQPIETAPRDGAYVLIYEGETTGLMWRAQWDESIGWMFGGTSDDHTAFMLFRCKPTHWMPLPEPPQ